MFDIPNISNFCVPFRFKFINNKIKNSIIPFVITVSYRVDWFSKTSQSSLVDIVRENGKIDTNRLLKS